jgi:hypothetical protein
MSERRSLCEIWSLLVTAPSPPGGASGDQLPPRCVFCVRNRFKMRRIAAALGPAKVIDLEASWNWASESHERDPVGLRPDCSPMTAAIALFIERELPNPARGRVATILLGNAARDVVAHFASVSDPSGPRPRHGYRARAAKVWRTQRQGHGMRPPFALSGDTKRGELVAGAGFEPATFWL